MGLCVHEGCIEEDYVLASNDAMMGQVDQIRVGVESRVDRSCSCRVGVQNCKKYADTNPTRDTNGLKKLNPNPTRPDTGRH